MTDFEREYRDFMGSDAHPPVDSLARRVILSRLDPSLKQVMMTFIAVTMLSSFMTLSICPQFGLGGFLFGHEVVHIAMAAGEMACGAFCALIFFSFSLLVSHVALPRVYRRKIARHKMVAAFTIPAAAMFLTMISAALMGQFVFMGLAFSIAWYAASAGLHLGFGYVWGRYASV